MVLSPESQDERPAPELPAWLKPAANPLVVERVTPTEWREVPAPAAPAAAAHAVADAPEETRNAAYALARAGLSAREIAPLLGIPVDEVAAAMSADIKRGNSETVLDVTKTLIALAKRGNVRAIEAFLKARAGPEWAPPSAQAQAAPAQLTHIVINTGVPRSPDAPPPPAKEIALTKRDYAQIPELRERST